MKLKSVAAFEKQLKESAPDHLSSIYLILAKDSFERKFYVSKLYKFLSHFKPNLTFCTGESFLEPQLFDNKKVVLLESEVKIKDLSKEVIVIFSLEKCTPSFYKEIENEIVALDLLEEKPWEKKQRLVQEIQKIAQMNKKNISLQVANKLLDVVGSDLSALKNEIEKLTVYISDRKSVEESDIEEITQTEKEITAWQVAESLVWKSGDLKRPIFKDLSEILSLISLVRHHIYLGIQICRGENISSLRKNQINTYLPFCKQVGINYFIDRLLFLFEWELKAKSSSIEYELLWDLLVIHYDTLPTAEFTSSRSGSKT